MNDNEKEKIYTTIDQDPRAFEANEWVSNNTGMRRISIDDIDIPIEKIRIRRVFQEKEETYILPSKSAGITVKTKINGDKTECVSGNFSNVGLVHRYIKEAQEETQKLEIGAGAYRSFFLPVDCELLSDKDTAVNYLGNLLVDIINLKEKKGE